MKICGKVHCFGDNVDTDVIIPARYLNSSSMKELAVHCMADIDANFATRVRPGDIIVAGKNFGCGSSREHAPAVIKECGVAAVIAVSFARIFYRNAINIGLPIMKCRDAALGIAAGDLVEVDLDAGVISNKTKNISYRAEPYPEFIKGIIDCGGLMGYIEKKANKKSFH